MTSTSAPHLEQLAAILLQQLTTNVTTNAGVTRPTEVKTEVVVETEVMEVQVQEMLVENQSVEQKA